MSTIVMLTQKLKLTSSDGTRKKLKSFIREGMTIKLNNMIVLGAMIFYSS